MRLFLLAFSLLLIFSGLRAAEPPPACPHCGRPVEKLPVGPPIAVTIDNHPAARPQSGLNQACLVFEAPVEGGLTRFMAVYGHGQEVPKIGPVRSMRPYFVRLAKSLGAVLAHCGGSPEAYALAPELGLPHLDDIRGAGRAFWRDQTRRAPHNLYTSTARLRAELRRAGLDRPAAPAGPDPVGQGFSGAPAAGVTLAFADRVSFTYEPVSGFYLRANRSGPHTDLEGRPLRAAAVVVIGVPVTVLDKVGRLRLDFGAADPAVVYQAGVSCAGSWPGITGRVARVLDAAGNPVALAAGTRWFVLVSSTVRVQPELAPEVEPVVRPVRIE